MKIGTVKIGTAIDVNFYTFFLVFFLKFILSAKVTQIQMRANTSVQPKYKNLIL